eukprot:gene5125-5773_t
MNKDLTDFISKYGQIPEYAQSNGKTENAVKTAKMLMKKAAESGSDFYLMPLGWRKAPSEGIDSSPSQRMSSRRAKSPLPMSKKIFQSKVVTSVQEKLHEWKHFFKVYYSRSTLKKDDVFQMRPGNNFRTSCWTLEQVGVRSYNVKAEDGRIFRRNLKFLYHTKEPFNIDEEDSIVSSSSQRNKKLWPKILKTVNY